MREVSAGDHSSILAVAVVFAAASLTGCTNHALFQSNFDASAIGQPPAQVQTVGTVASGGGLVVVAAAPAQAQPSGKWVQITRSSPSELPGLLCTLSGPGGPGKYEISATLFIAAGAGAVSLQLEPGSGPTELANFLHLDFVDDTVRLDDDANVKFGTFPHNKPFIVQVTLNTTPPSPSAHIVLGGDGASGVMDYALRPRFPPVSRELDGVRFYMGSPHMGTFFVTNVVASTVE
jgi:hypothetical protein